MGHLPVLLPVLLRLTPEGTARQIRDETAIVVEGFPRSGNTFTVFALQYLTDDTIHVASHVHHPAQFICGVRRALPTVVVVRPPVETLASYLIAGPHGTVPMVIREYLYYHRQVLRHSHSLLIATFDQVTTDLEHVVRRVNERWGTDLPEHTPDEKEVEAIFARIDVQFRRYHPDERGMIARPDPGREGLNERLRSELSSPRHARSVERCVEVYRALESLAE